jgi:hypothetical protein
MSLEVRFVFASLSANYLNDRLPDGKRELAALTAVVAANVILFGYVAVALREDQGTDRDKKD